MIPAFTVAALELASGACMAVSGIKIVTSGRERQGQQAAGQWLAAVKRWQAWLALLSALAWCPALFLAWQVGVQQACIVALCITDLIVCLVETFTHVPRCMQGGNTQQVWRYAWLPLGPLAFALLAAQVDASLSASVRHAAQLRRHMYSFKEL